MNIFSNVTQSHHYTVHIEFCRTDHFRNSFIPRTSRLHRYICVFPPSYDMLAFKRNVYSLDRIRFIYHLVKVIRMFKLRV